MSFASSITVNVDAVTEQTIANASGDVLFQLGKTLFDEVSRLRRHAERAQSALDDAHDAPRHTQDAVGAELAATQERMERLLPLGYRCTPPFVNSASLHFVVGCGYGRRVWSIADVLTAQFIERTALSASHERAAAMGATGSYSVVCRRSFVFVGDSSSTSSRCQRIRHDACSTRLPAAAQQTSGVAAGRDTLAAAPTSSTPSSSSSAARGAQALPPTPSAAPPTPTAAENVAEAIYDVVDYDDRIYGYVGGCPVPVVPDDLQILSRDMLQDLEDEIRRRRREAVDDLVLVQQRLKNTASDADEAIIALVTEGSALEAAVAKADRLHRAVFYEYLHRDPASGEFIEERETQRRLIEAERRRLEAGGAPIYWCRRDQDEARRVHRHGGSRGYTTWHPASWSSAGPTPSSRRPLSSSRTRSRSRVRFDLSSSSAQPTATPSRSSSPPAENPWVPRDGSSHARQQLRDLVHRQVLQRQGHAVIPPCRVVHVSAFHRDVDDAALKRLMVHHGFDVDEESRVVEYKVTSSLKGREHHYYGFVTFLHMSAAERCVRQLDPMGVDGHGGMTPIRERNDGSFGHVKLTFSFSNNKKINADAVRLLDALGVHAGRTSSRAPSARRQPRAATPGRRQHRAATPGRRQPSRAPAPLYDSDSDETGLEDH